MRNPVYLYLACLTLLIGIPTGAYIRWNANEESDRAWNKHRQDMAAESSFASDTLSLGEFRKYNRGADSYREKTSHSFSEYMDVSHAASKAETLSNVIFIVTLVAAGLAFVMWQKQAAPP